MSAIPLTHHRTHQGWVFTSGQIGRDPEGNIPAEFEGQARQAIMNLRHHLEAAGASLSSVVKTTVFLTCDTDFAAMNQIYASYFTEPWPARSTIVAAMAHPDLLFEIEAIAVVE
jgi:2-iminobutanoate/2-iminopropanoate deaminase